MDVYKWYSVSRWLYLHHVPVLPMVIKAGIRILWGGVIPYQAQIGKGTILGYQALGVVIHKRCVIGENCHIAQNVTIGGTSNLYEVPVLGDKVQVGVGAVIVGPVHVGDNVIVGANAVVNKDIPPNSVAVGIPAKVIKTLAPDSKATI
ncbi:serine acetyltransferase [Gordonibacter massiliensis]|uniref:Serine acetyltransferase n=2 Tax=Gordonibacter massiliensis (ex Traore et al. 2017) TaxID=1841863 RepID=A0A842JCT1_9ACTN|nr:serine acetyltransferase [Gordonibacter massiliensis (ex Traore et al. 2017)]MBC2888696.1 serine acetyltransferase [Gordonibacter massiliensis (ex Traore et al. 2017)]